MSTLTIKTDHDYRHATLSGVTNIVFNVSGGIGLGVFNASQFDDTQISSTVHVTGDSQFDEIDVKMLTTDGSFSIAGWTFDNWSFKSLVVEGSTAADTVSGNDTAYVTFIGGKGADHLTAGLGGGVFEYFHPNEIAAGETLDGGTGAGGSLYLGGAGTYNLSLVTMTDVRYVQFSANDVVAKFSASQVQPGALFTAVSVDGNHGDVLEIDGAHNIDLSGSGYDNSWASNGTIHIIGTSAADVLVGSPNQDVIDGKGGADDMKGGGGDDTYVVANTGDVVDERHGSGKDLVQASISFSLADATHVFGKVEDLTLTGNAVNGIGNTLANVITGDALSNTLTGGDGTDRFIFNTAPGPDNIDNITDFSPGTDSQTYERIGISRAVFQVQEVQGGTLTDVPLVINNDTFYAAAGAKKAHDANDHFIYNTTTGVLYFDKDGLGHAGAVELAVLDGAPTITVHNFLIVA